MMKQIWSDLQLTNDTPYGRGTDVCSELYKEEPTV